MLYTGVRTFCGYEMKQMRFLPSPPPMKWMIRRSLVSVFVLAFGYRFYYRSRLTSNFECPTSLASPAAWRTLLMATSSRVSVWPKCSRNPQIWFVSTVRLRNRVGTTSTSTSRLTGGRMIFASWRARFRQVFALWCLSHP